MSKDKKTLVIFNDIKKMVCQPENWVTKEKFCFDEVTFKIIKDYGGTIISDLIEVELDEVNNQLHFLKGNEQQLKELMWKLYRQTTFNCKKITKDDSIIALFGRHYRKSTVKEAHLFAVDVGLKSQVAITDCIKLPVYTEEEEYAFAKLAFYQSEGKEPDMNNEKDMLAISAIQLGISFAHRNISSLK